jgi:guanosine-3',5'-bis(diphosphate) 3'-pyrophosphohydrolase
MTDFLWRRARDMAIEAHGDQKYGDDPYIVHLDEVTSILAEYGYSDDVTLAAGVLHDAIEDTKLTADELIPLDPDADVRFIVVFCTDEKGPNRKTRKALTYARMRQTIEVTRCPDGSLAPVIFKCLRVKLADRLANMRRSQKNNPGLFAMYQKEAGAFKDALYVPGVADQMWAEYDLRSAV